MTIKEFPTLGERYYEQRLENGMLVRVIPKPGFAKRYAFVATDFGSIDTKFTMDGKQYQTPDGVAHYLEHKMFDMPDGNAMQAFASFGGGNNAFTNYTMTAYYVECTEQFEENLSVLLRMVTTPYFTDESVEKERGIIAQEIKMYADSADSAVFENLFAAMYQYHPARIPIAGTVESIAGITAQTLNDCHRAFYDPSNLMLCVMGDVDPEAVVRQAQEQTPKGCGLVAERDYGPQEALAGHQTRVEANMEVSMPTFVIGFKCPPSPKGDETMRQEIIGDLAAEILIGESSPLYMKLYDENVIDSDFSAGFERMKGLSLLDAAGDSENPDAVLQAMLDEAAHIGQAGIDPVQFERLKKSAIGRRTRELDSFESTCYRMCAATFDGVEYLRFPEIFASVTMEDVEQFLKETVIKERAAISIVYPKED